ncbi:Uncharacterized protein conserved in bacteria [Cedecea neteri]|uniref:Uncharacterized protein conserved in bacteria n=1 Tax=Cedecea neteri TaxID=158822 RepID=A0A2X2T3F1_9ENTR|nr:Uncharacterized protein conserved in bacteria [Cedecea neteri]
MLGQEMRIWQNISVPDLVHDLLNEHKISLLDLQLNGSYEKREYCVQYRESALSLYPTTFGRRRDLLLLQT